jgi:alkylated DNA repair dioxygenase AlkB
MLRNPNIKFTYVKKESATITPTATASQTKMQTTTLDERSFVDFDANFVSNELADEILKHLLSDIDWRHTAMTGKSGEQYRLPRLQCWMSDEGVVAQLYQKEPAMKWSPQVMDLKQKLEKLLNTKFDYVLMNLYRDGEDKIGYHRDDEAEEEGKNVIASLSFGAPRTFFIKHNRDRKKIYSFELPHGSLITMRGDTQLNWLHSIPPAPEVKTPRVNLTFRKS